MIEATKKTKWSRGLGWLRDGSTTLGRWRRLHWGAIWAQTPRRGGSWASKELGKRVPGRWIRECRDPGFKETGRRQYGWDREGEKESGHGNWPKRWSHGGKGCVACEVLTEHCIDFGLTLGKVCSHQRAWNREATCSDLRQRNCSCYCVENTQHRQKEKLKESRQDTINQLWDHGVRFWGSKYEHYCWLKRRWKHWRQQWFPWYWILSSHREHRST